MAYGNSGDQNDEYVQISETVSNEAFKVFCRLIVEKFGQQYLNSCPTVAEKQRTVDLFARRWFPGCFGSWDCKHFTWKNCPVRLAGQHKGHSKGGEKSLIREAVCDSEIYFWYVFFGEPGSLNDLNVLGKSTIVGSILSQEFDMKIDEYRVNGVSRDWLYFLVDGIYPKLPFFVTTYAIPSTQKQLKFCEFQEGKRKDIERAFGVLVQRFGILQRPIRSWYMNDIRNILHTCIILHNMCVEARRHNFTFSLISLEAEQEQQQQQQQQQRLTLFSYEDDAEYLDATVQEALSMRVASMSTSMEEQQMHFDLKNDLTEHINNID